MGKTGLTRAQKRQVVAALMSEAGTLAEFWTAKGLGDIDCVKGRDYLASLMRKMPGDWWDTRLGPPDKPGHLPAKTEYESDVAACHEHPDVDLGED